MKLVCKGNFCILLCFFCCSCSSTRGYSGPELPKNKISTIYFYANPPLEVQEMAVDGRTQGFFDLGLEVLPGEHHAWAEFSIKQSECDSDGCAASKYSGKCDISLRTDAGHSYAIRISGYTDTAYVDVKDRANDTLAGSGSCRTLDHDYNYKVIRQR